MRRIDIGPHAHTEQLVHAAFLLLVLGKITVYKMIGTLSYPSEIFLGYP